MRCFLLLAVLVGCAPIRDGDRVRNLEDGRPGDVSDDLDPESVLVITCNPQGDPTNTVTETWLRWQTERVSAPQYDLTQECAEWVQTQKR